MQLTWFSNKVIVTANRTERPASNIGLLPTSAFSKGARLAVVVQGMHQADLMSVATLANNWYTAVFLPEQQGMDIYHANNVNISSITPSALPRWQDNQGLWKVQIVDEPTVNPSIDIT